MLQRFFRGLALATLLFVGIGVTAVGAQSLPSEEELNIAEADLTVNDGPHFFADRQVLLDDTYLGSVYTAGGEVRLTGTVDGDLIIAGGSVVIDGTVTDDVYAAGGTVIINGDVGGNVTAAGGEVRIDAHAEVVGSVIAAAQTYSHQGTVLGDIMVAGKNIKLAGMVGQSARIEADKLEIGDMATIGENLQAEVRRESMISDSAQIVGTRNISVQQQTTREKQVSPVSWSAKWLFGMIGRILVMVIGLAVFGGVIKKAASIFDRRWPDALWKGAAFTVIVPFLIVTLMLTIIGFPAAVLVGIVYVFIMFTAWVMPAYWLGRLLLPKVSHYAQGIVGAVIVSLVTFIPVFGWVVRLLLAVLGTGALLDLWRRGSK